ncbi:MAG: hypothetical protein ABIU20_10585 [Blastocatellia bacterium]
MKKGLLLLLLLVGVLAISLMSKKQPEQQTSNDPLSLARVGNKQPLELSIESEKVSSSETGISFENDSSIPCTFKTYSPPRLFIIRSKETKMFHQEPGEYQVTIKCGGTAEKTERISVKPMSLCKITIR